MELGFILFRVEIIKQHYQPQFKQLQFSQVKEGEKERVPAERINVVSPKMIKESNLLYKDCIIRSPEDGYRLLKQFLGEVDREYFIVICLDTKNQPTAINTCHISSLNAAIVHPREVL